MVAYSYKKRRNASVVALSPEFKAAIRVTRSRLGLPDEGLKTGQEREEWYKRHHSENTKERYRPLPRFYWYFPKELVELVESFAYSSEASKVNYYPDVPLDSYAMELIRRFDLPDEVVDQIKAYILGENGALSAGSALQPILLPMDKGAKYVVLVAGIDASSTQKDWLEVWRKIEIVLRLSGTGRTPPKRPIDSLLFRDLSFWKQIEEGKTARQVADDWMEEHPEDKGYPVEDMVRKAVDRVRRIMRPKS